MIIQQLSVFLENKSGRLNEILDILGKANIRIIAATVADTCLLYTSPSPRD